MLNKLLLSLMFFTFGAIAQNEDAYKTETTKENGGLLDPTRLSINHSLSFGAGGSGLSNLKSQSLYSTMLQYKFAAPVTLNLNFDLPIHSTFSSSQNFSTDNLQSLDYFKNIPFDFSLNWQPSQNTMMRFSISRNSYENSYFLNRYYRSAQDYEERN